MSSKKKERNDFQSQQLDDQIGESNIGNSKDQDHMDYVKTFDLDVIKTPKEDDIIQFSNLRRKKVYQSMDIRQQHRFDDFMASGFEDKKIKDLLQEILGGKGKIVDEVVQVFRTTTKLYCGQLTEEARLVQIEELALKKGGRHMLDPVLQLEAIKPHHLQEARRRLLKLNILLPPKPKGLFLRKR